MVVSKYDKDMCSGPLLGKMLIYAVPILFMNILQLLFNAADMIVVGRFSGSHALAAVGATGALINLLVNLFMGFSVGTSVAVAQDIGAGKPDHVSRTVHTSMTVSVIGGIIVMAVGIAFCEPLLRIMGTPSDIISLSVLYMKIYFLGIPAAMIYNFGAAILNASGDSRRPMYYLLISGILNVFLNLFFVIVLKMSVAGVAWATVISQYLAMTLIVACLCRSDGVIRLTLRRILCFDRHKLAQIVRIGLPAGLQNVLFSVSNVLIQSAVNSFGSVMVAANSASANIEGLIGTTMNAFYNTAITFTGQNMGAKKYDRIDRVAKISTVFVLTTWLAIGGLTILFGRPLLSIYTSDPEVIRLGFIRLTIMMAGYFTGGIMVVFPGLNRGMGYSVLPMLITLFGACFMRIVWLYTIFSWHPVIMVLYLCYPITWALAGIGQVFIFLYARKKVRQPLYKEDIQYE